MSGRPGAHESTTHSSKKNNYAALYTQLQVLDKNITKLQKNLQVTAEQVPTFHNLETLHSSMFLVTSQMANQKKKD
ncbi:hypothetical protein INT45_010834 [Circinella minor]|uniref:Uncharacterized protein n=1 Tax=Circinella minor TaxID=1195481 RepID=A0A8H7VLD3_9FUNG|nr:hypothetical protein INT45_010834 [Circinella minor]